MGIDRQLLGKAFTDIDFFRGLWALIDKPTWKWGKPQLGEVGEYEFPDSSQAPQFAPGDLWGPWLYDLDLYLIRELNLDTASMVGPDKGVFFTIRTQIVNLARRPEEHRQEVRSSWAEFTAMTNTLSQGGGGVC